MADNRENTMVNYWQSRYEQEKKRTDACLRLAAERATEIDELRKMLNSAQREIVRLQRILEDHEKIHG